MVKERIDKMTEIDLHGYKYSEVEDKLPNLLILHYNMGNFPIRVITGNSEQMKKVVREIITKHDFTEETFWDNRGSIVVR